MNGEIRALLTQLLLVATLWVGAGCSSLGMGANSEDGLPPIGLGGCGGGVGLAGANYAYGHFEDRIRVEQPRAAVVDRARRFLGNAGLSVEALSPGELHGSGGSGLDVRVSVVEETPTLSIGVVCGQWRIPTPVGSPGTAQGEKVEPRTPTQSHQRMLMEGLVRAMEHTGT